MTQQEAPKVSVIIPCYNAAAFILEAIDSVRAQGVAKLEIIVVDDGSSDASVALLERHAPEVRVIAQPNAGPAAARNRGIQAAQGDYIGFLDADDIWLDGKLAAQIRVLDSQPEVAVCYGLFEPWHCDPDGVYRVLQGAAVAADTRPLDDILLPLLLLFDAAVWTPAALVRRAALGDALRFDETLAVGEDYDLWLRLSLRYRFARLPVTVALYRNHPTSLTKRAPLRNFEKTVVAQNFARLSELAPVELLSYLRPMVQQRLAELDFSYARACFDARCRAEARRSIRLFLSHRLTARGAMIWLLSSSALLFTLAHGARALARKLRGRR